MFVIKDYIYISYILASLVQVLFWIGPFLRFALYEEGDLCNTSDDNIPQDVSVIICARNEEKNIKKNFDRILNQRYRSHELIAINDNSTDETLSALLHLNKKYYNLRIISIKDSTHTRIGKKFALSKGIEAARFETILLTDADCMPASDFWILKMQNVIKGDTTIGLGYAPYKEEKGFLNKFIRFETVYTAIQYFSFALIGMPYMGVGRNLIYKKTLYEKVGGFVSHEHIISGDDDLFINQVANKKNTKIILDPDTFMYSDAKKTWAAYFLQKSRHLTTGKHYETKHQILLALLSFSHFWHYVGGALIIVLKVSTIFAATLFAVRLLIIAICYSLILKKLRDFQLLKWVILLDALYVLFYVLFAQALMIGKTNKWK